ncbi:MAG: integrase core domain-containing protein [Candidatus Latescibacterota bacterium]|jgi:transposase InsO family protein|nr:integrase core domain-containing protein [Candidatus Latescibacterota bacterium]MEE2727029.1 integrase core domain-containing protein [Candidatus Latescibacterota bacterium]
MKQKQHSTEEIIRILRQADTDQTVESICREHNISKAIFHRWKRKYGDIESFHSRFRDEFLNREWLLNLREAHVVIEDWRQHYNTERPHSQLGYLSPEGFINTQKVSTKAD